MGEGERQVHGRAGVAPFEDILQLFIPIDSPLDAALLSSVVVAVQARHPEGRYSLRLTGRACAGPPLNTHVDRNMLEPWIPEGAKAGGLTVVSFAAERVELTRSEAETPVRYHGPTRLGQQPRSRPQMWALAAFGGVAGPFAVIAFLAPWISLVIAGEQVPWRTLALLLRRRRASLRWRACACSPSAWPSALARGPGPPRRGRGPVRGLARALAHPPPGPAAAGGLGAAGGGGGRRLGRGPGLGRLAGPWDLAVGPGRAAAPHVSPARGP